MNNRMSSLRFLLPLPIIFIHFLAMSLFLKMVFIVENWHFLLPEGFGSMIWALFLGMRFDISILAYFFIPGLVIFYAVIMTKARFAEWVTLFDDPSNQVSYRAATHLFRVCQEQTGNPHFGLLHGQRCGLDILGFVGLLVKYSLDVRTALHTLVRHMHLNIRGAVTTISEDDKLAVFSYEIYAPGAVVTDQIGDASLATMFNVMSALCGPHWKPIEVRFAHRRPSDLAPYHRFFQAPLRFEMDRQLAGVCRQLVEPAATPRRARAGSAAEGQDGRARAATQG